MYTQRKRAAAREDEEDGPDGPDESGETADEPENPEGPEDRLSEESGTDARADDPEQPSDLKPDTASESTDPSGTGERVDR
jgi:hypothetical protein